MGVLNCKPIFYVLRLHDVNIIYSWRHKRAQELTIINVMNVHILYCDLMDFPYMDIFMRNVF